MPRDGTTEQTTMKALLPILLISLSGCSSISSRTDGFGEPYSGAKDAVCYNDFMLKAFNDNAFLVGLASLPFNITNLVLSTVVDTVLLPIDVVSTKPPQKHCNLVQPPKTLPSSE